MSSKGYPTDFFHTNKILQRVAALWLPGQEIRLLYKILFYIWMFLCYSVCISFYICELIILRETIKDLNKFVRQFGLLFTHSVGVFKLYNLVIRTDSIRKIMETLQDGNYYYEGLGDFQPALMMAKAKKLTSRVSILIFSLYLFAGFTAHVSSTVSINKEVKGNHFQGNLTCYDFVPYYFHIPFEVQTKFQCQMAFTFMHLGLDVFAFVIGAHDGLFVTFLNCLRIQIEIVQGAFKTIRERCLKKLNIPADYQVSHDEENPELEKMLYDELSHCTRHLNILLQLRSDIENLFTYITLAQTLASLIIFASCLYVASSVSFTSPEFFAQVEYFTCVFLQLSSICFFGNEITVASSQIGSSLYECDWFSTSTRFKRSMLITMSRVECPVYISIGKFSPLTLATLVAVSRGSFSYFALFQSIQ